MSFLMVIGVYGIAFEVLALDFYFLRCYVRPSSSIGLQYPAFLAPFLLGQFETSTDSGKPIHMEWNALQSRAVKHFNL